MIYLTHENYTQTHIHTAAAAVSFSQRKNEIKNEIRLCFIK
jgi:hypothetical protein